MRVDNKANTKHAWSSACCKLLVMPACTTDTSCMHTPPVSLSRLCTFWCHQLPPVGCAVRCVHAAQERAFIERVSNVQYNVKMGFVPNMNVPGTFYVNDNLKDLLFEELAQHVQRGEVSKGCGSCAAAAAYMHTSMLGFTHICAVLCAVCCSTVIWSCL